MWTYNDTYLMHYGVKGMKWGQRHDYVPTGRYRFINRRASSPTSSKTSSQSTRSSSSKSKYATPQQRKIMNRIKIAKAAAIVAGTTMVAYGAYRWTQVLGSPTGKQMISKGKLAISNRLIDYSNRARNVRRLTKNAVRAPMNMVRSTPVGRVTSNVLSAPKRVIGGSRAGRTVLKVYGTAATISDINSTQQWVRQMKKNGKVTKKDVGNLAKDLINPLPDNIPGINKNAREARRRRRDAKNTK